MKLFDSHFHIIDTQFPLVANQGYLPPAFTSEDYLQTMAKLPIDLIGGVVVSGSFQAFDQSYLLSALQTLGRHFVATTQLPFHVEDQTILQLNEARVRAIRFNIKRGMTLSLNAIETLAKRCYELAEWHSEFYVDSTALPSMESLLLSLPRVSIDHLGLSEDGFSDLLQLVEKGIYVKATGFSRLNFPVLPALKEIVAINADCLMFGTDLPGTRAPKVFDQTDLALITDHFSQDKVKKIFYQNALRFYRIKDYQDSEGK